MMVKISKRQMVHAEWREKGTTGNNKVIISKKKESTSSHHKRKWRMISLLASTQRNGMRGSLFPQPQRNKINQQPMELDGDYHSIFNWSQQTTTSRFQQFQFPSPTESNSNIKFQSRNQMESSIAFRFLPDGVHPIDTSASDHCPKQKILMSLNHRPCITEDYVSG